MSVWDNEEFVQKWNETYGLDMSKAPIRPGIVYPLIAARICWPQKQHEKIRIVDFGCGNGNLIRAFLNRPFVEWLGIDNGHAILATAHSLAVDTRVKFLNQDIGQKISEVENFSAFDHAISVFTLEEISSKAAPVFFDNMAKAVYGRAGSVHIFTQHPAYAFHKDILSDANGVPNEKFQGHEGYFDTKPSSYNLALLNREHGVDEQPAYYHKPFAAIVNGLANAGLCLREVVEVPAGVGDIESLLSHEPKRGDVPRFLYLRAQTAH